MTPEQTASKGEIPQAAVVVGGLAVQFSVSKKPLLSACRLTLGSLPHATVQEATCCTEAQDRVFVKIKQSFGGILAQGNACIGNKISQVNSRFLTSGYSSLHCKGTWYLHQHLQLDWKRHPKPLFSSVLITHLATVLCDQPSTSIIHLDYILNTVLCDNFFRNSFY